VIDVKPFEMVVVITGDRDWTDGKVIYNRLSQLPKNSLVITGGCRGADYLADFFAKNRGLTTHIEKAEWYKHGLGAGPKRNTKMLLILNEARKLGKETLVIAFHNNLEKSKGTKNCVNQAIAMDWEPEIVKSC
jgi:hypothetical protein